MLGNLNLTIAHTYSYTQSNVLTTYTDKERNYFRQNWFLINHFKTVIFNLCCADNTNDNNILSLFSLLITIIFWILSVLHEIREKEIINYIRVSDIIFVTAPPSPHVTFRRSPPLTIQAALLIRL